MIEVDQYCKTYRDVQAVDQLSFRVEPGQVLGLVGPNGAGKTTTIRAITGIIPASSGRLSIAGHDIANEARQAKAQLAYIPDDPTLFDLLTVEEHLRLTAEIYEVPKAEQAAVFDRLLDQFVLQEKRATCASDLSRGMRQKLAICCAYLHDPLAILFDEPFTGLDPYAIRDLKNSIRERAQDGAAVIVSSHLLSMVEDICSHILILDKGQRRFFGSLDELRRTYASAANLEEVFFQATGTREAVPITDPIEPAE